MNKKTIKEKDIEYKGIKIHLNFINDTINIEGIDIDFVSVQEANRYIDEYLADESWCQRTLRVLGAKQRKGISLTDDEYEAYTYAEGTLASIEAEIRYLNGENN